MLMKEDLISLETAKLAKKKGFDLSCKYYYGDYGLSGTKMGMHGNPNNYLSCFSAPTMEDLHKWIKTKSRNKIRLKVHRWAVGDYEGIIWYKGKQIQDHIRSSSYNKTYDETLYKSLKLIE